MVVGNRIGWIGVDIGSRSVKLAQVEQQGTLLRLRDALVVSREAPWPADPSRPLSSRDEIRAGLSLSDVFRGNLAASVLSMSRCEHRVLEGIPAGDRLQAVASKLSTVEGARMSGLVFEHWAADPDGTPDPEEGLAVHVLSTSTNWSEQVANDTNRSGLNCQLLDGLPQAMARAVALAQTPEQEPLAMAVDLGYRSLTLCVASGGYPLFVRVLREYGVVQLLDILQQRLGINECEASRMLSRYGLVCGDSKDRVSELIDEYLADPLTLLIDQLRRTIVYLKNQRRPLAPHRIWLMGGGATIGGLGQRLQEQLGLPVRDWTLPEGSGLNSAVSGDAFQAPSDLCLFAPALALSALAWEMS